METVDATATANSTATPAINRVAIKLPTFWNSDAAAWFRRIEAQFALHCVNSQQTKYDHVLAVLPETVVQRVRGACMHPPATNMYDFLKSEILRVYDLSKSRRAEAIINLEPLGDRLPSELLSQIQSLRGDITIDDILRAIFLDRLPKALSHVLRALDELPLETLAAAADRMASATPVDSSGVFELSAPEAVHAISRSRSTALPHRRSPTTLRNNDDSVGLCFYHKRFGKKARRCIKPCSWQGNHLVGSM